MKQFIQQLLMDKLGSYSMRELVIGVLLAALIVSWIAKQFWGKDVPEFMFYTFGSLIAAGCFGYTFEKKPGGIGISISSGSQQNTEQQ